MNHEEVRSVMETIIENWDFILEHTCKEHNISPVSFDSWLSPLKPYKMEGDKVYIMVTNNNMMAIDYLNRKYKLPLQVSIGEFIGKSCEIEFILQKDIQETTEKKT